MFLGLLWFCVMLHYAWPNACTGGEQRPSQPLPPPRQRSRDPKPFPGLTRKPPCGGYFQETHGTPLHGKRVVPERLVWAVGALAEGLGIRAVARVFEVDPNTVLAWLVEVAEHAAAFSQYFLHAIRV